MVEDATTAQARLLLSALHSQVADSTSKLAMVERRIEERSYAANSSERRLRHQLRQELHEVQRLIDGIHRRFPELSTSRTV